MDNLSQLIDKYNVNSFILGFPKCATTSLAHWLEYSPLISITGPKETNMFVPEFHNVVNTFTPSRLGDAFKIRIEATTLNVYSQQLLETLAHRPKIKVIILIRPLCDVAESWHRQMQKANFIEESECLENMLDANNEKGLKNYNYILSQGTILNQWISRLGHERILIVNASELQINPTELAIRLERFYKVKLKLPSEIAETNVFSIPRNERLYSILRTPIIKNRWYKTEKIFPSLRNFRVFFRENVLLKKVAKRKKLKSENYPWLSKEEMVALKLHEENSKRWSAR